MPTLTERRASQDVKFDVPVYPASVFSWQEAEALNGVRVGARVSIQWDQELPRGGTVSTYT